jgi:site-specific DNA recombinase
MYEEGFLEREGFRARMTAAQARLDALQTESRRAVEQETSESELRAVISHLKAFAEQLQTGLDECDWETRQAIVRALVKRIVIEENDLRVVYKVSHHPFEAAPQGRGVLHYCWRHSGIPPSLARPERASVADGGGRGSATATSITPASRKIEGGMSDSMMRRQPACGLSRSPYPTS